MLLLLLFSAQFFIRHDELVTHRTHRTHDERMRGVNEWMNKSARSLIFYLWSFPLSLSFVFRSKSGSIFHVSLNISLIYSCTLLGSEDIAKGLSYWISSYIFLLILSTLLVTIFYASVRPNDLNKSYSFCGNAMCSKNRGPAYANLHIVYNLGNMPNSYHDISQ